MDVFSAVFVFLLSIAILVIFHEYGHFIVARLNNVKVLNFAIGFGKSLVKYQGRKGTLYSINLFPLGGYVKMLDSRESSVISSENYLDFNRKHPLQKISIVIAGPLFNFILAFFCFFIMYQIGVIEQDPIIYDIDLKSVAEKSGMSFDFDSKQQGPVKIIKIGDKTVKNTEDVQLVLSDYIGSKNKQYIKINILDNNKVKKYKLDLSEINFYKDVDLHSTSLVRPLGIWMLPKKITIDSVLKDSSASKSGLEKNDIILGIKNEENNIFDVLSFIKDNPNEEVILKISRDNLIQYIKIIIGSKDKQGFLGISFKTPFSYSIKKYNFLNSLNQSAMDTYKYTEKSFTMIFKLLFGELGLENIHGPLMVAKVADNSWDVGISQFLKFLGIISIGLGVINLLPVPLLDGGHIVYHLVEWINPKWITKALEELWFKAGISFIIFLFFLAVYNDIKYW